MKDINLPEILLKHRAEMRLSQSEMAKHLGVSLKSYQVYERGEKQPRQVKTESILGILKYFEVNKLGESIVNEPKAEYLRTKTVPVFDIRAEGSNVSSFDDDLSELPKSFVQVPGFEDCTFAVYVWNHSMYPTYENGCMVIVKQIINLSAIQFGSVYLIITDEQRVVKRLYEDDDFNFIVLASDNPEARKDGKPKYPSYRVKKEHIKKLYLVKGTIKRTEI